MCVEHLRSECALRVGVGVIFQFSSDLDIVRHDLDRSGVPEEKK